MQNHAKVGGVLAIISGAFGVLWLLFFLLVAGVMFLIPGDVDFHDYDYAATDGFYIFMMVFYGILGFFYLALGVLAIVGGALALKQRHWGWALAGSIAAILTFFPCGIPAVIFISLGRPEFAMPGTPAPAALITG